MMTRGSNVAMAADKQCCGMKKRTTVLLLALLSAVLGVGRCQSSSDGKWQELMTYNTYLPYNTTTVSHYNLRRTAFMNSINTTDSGNPWRTADVVCLQEIGELTDRAEVVTRARQVGLKYSYTSGQLETELTGSACSAVVLASALICVNKACPTAMTPTLILACLLQHCQSDVEKVPQVCINCITSGSGTSPEIVDKCTKAPAANYPSHLHLMLLSRTAISNAGLTAFRTTPQIGRRGYIRAEVADVGTVFCTHQTPDLSEVFQNATFKNGQKTRNLADTKALINAAQATDSVVMGNLNTGLSVAAQNISALFSDSYDYAITQGFISPYVNSTRISELCTFCTTNLINAGLKQLFPSAMLFNQIVDHIMVNPSRYFVNNNLTSRLFVGNVVPVPAPGQDIPMSHHYGVRIGVRQRATSGSSHRAVASWLSVVMVCAASVLVWISS